MVLVGIIHWQRELHGRIPFSVHLTDPDGKAIFSIEGHTYVEVRSESMAPAKTQLILPMKKVMFPTPGHYRVKININGSDLDGPSMHLIRSA